MGYQSAVLGYDFGINYETGKRTVKSVPSDLFNRIRSGDDTPINVVYDGQEYTIPTHQYFDFLRQQHMQKMLTNFRNELPNSSSVMTDIIEFSVQIEKMKAERTPSAWAEILTAFGGASQTEVVTWLDSLPETERNFLLTLSPLLALMYTTAKSGLLQPIPIGNPPPTPSQDLYASVTLDFSWTDTCNGGQLITSHPTGTAQQHLDFLSALQSEPSGTTTCEIQYFNDRNQSYQNVIEAYYGMTIAQIQNALGTPA